MTALDRVLAASAVGLTATLVVQVAVRANQPARITHTADWAEAPESLEDAAGISEEVVRARVVNIRPGEDLVLGSEDEPGGLDRIPTEVVTFRVQRGYKSRGRGGPPETIELFHMGRSTGEDHIGVMEDPPYARGEEYVLFLKQGPDARAGGTAVQTRRVASPKGRYQVRGGRIEPAARGGWAAAYRGRPVDEFEGEVQRGVERSAGRRPGN